jgi:hypothetical protein
MSPSIHLSVDSVAWDRQQNIMYVGVRQIFSIFPAQLLGYEADVRLVTKLTLDFDEVERKYIISSQEDLYQTTEFAKFVWFGIWRVVWLGQILSTLVCLILATIFAPISWIEERHQIREASDTHNNLPPITNGTTEGWEKAEDEERLQK